MKQSQIFTKSFYQTHDKNTRKFLIGQQVEMEKQPKKNGKILSRQVRLQETNMIQIKNQKTIKYPNGFLLITKQEFEKLPENQKTFFRWTTNQSKNVRILFDRSSEGLNKTQIQQFEKPTAVYFDNIEAGIRFAEFLKFKNQERLNHFNDNLTRIQSVWFHLSSLKIVESSIEKMNNEAQQIQYQQLKEQNEFLLDFDELLDYDKPIYEEMLNILFKKAEYEEKHKKQNIKQQKVEIMKQSENFFKNKEVKAIRQLLYLWRQVAGGILRENEELEEYQQRELEDEERKLQTEIDAIENEQQRISQIQQSQIQQQHQQQNLPQYKDLHLTKFKLIIGQHIKLFNPILYVYFKGLESNYQGKIEFDKGQEINFMQLDKKGWTAELEVTLSGFQMQDALDIVIYDDYQEVNEKILARAQEEQNNILAFLATAKKVMQGRIYMRDFEKNLNNNRRHFASLEVSANLQQKVTGNQLLNVPMIQMDIYEDSPFSILNSTVNPFYLDIIEVPFTAQEMKYFARQLKSPFNSLQQQWDSFKVEALEFALQVRGQIWVNSKQSEDDLIEIQEFIVEEQGIEEQKGKFTLLAEYLQVNPIQNKQDFVKNKLIQACRKGFTKQSRNELIPIFLQFNNKITKFLQDIGIEWNQNESILDLIQNEINQYIEQDTILSNHEKVQHYLDSLQFRQTTVWTDQYIKKLQLLKDRIAYLLNCFELSNHKKNQLILTVRLFQLFNLREDCDDYVLKIILCLDYKLMIPKMQCDKLDFQWFRTHMNNLFSDFFYFDIWLRVFDYIIGIGFVNGDFDRAIASVIGGILNEVDSKKYRTKEEFITGLTIYGKLLCDPEKLIMACYNSYNHQEFIYLESDEQILEILTQNGNPSEQICKDQIQQQQQQSHQQSIIIDVPEEHEGSIYEIHEQYQQSATQQRSQQKYLFKQKVEKIHILIHSMYLHQIVFHEQNVVTIQNQRKNEQDGLYFELPFTSQSVDIQINENFKAQIDIGYLLVNTIYKNTLILNDNYDMERNYQISELEYSILLIGEGLPYERVMSKDNAINSFNDLAQKFKVQHNFSQHPDAFKLGNVLSFADFNQLMQHYFKLDQASYNLDELYQKFMLKGNQQIYLIDILLKLNQNNQKQLEVLNLFIPNEKISHKQLRREQLENNGDVKFLKVILSDENYGQSVDLTTYFNGLLLDHYLKYNSYDMLLIDHKNRLYLLDNAGSFLSQLRTQTLILSLKFSSFGNIRNLQYQLNKQFKLTMEQQTSATSIKELLENNSRLISLDNNCILMNEKASTFNSHLAYLRCRDGSKQFYTCDVIGKILNKNDEVQYYVVQLELDKRIIKSKEDVLLFDSIPLEELEVYDKTWKQVQ
ncbi:unnamed protein product (macronuclear) [Paramecium tetraurelia]|uniref:Rab-GAP TBC domain-containing protein n=1 Tax=Paramecium tetraurelia TaxID=5888 RepID=A0DNE4_PARTE|nr:uncharacterized protein GSPATT00018757001 [Paramecium tetraurelia]CAK84561.1 unnamed protein product [Paramecium tetraurelia]|eukprot:XP_001451958.1 hypothetical protein (macronuclear) [Paramecium tetraurelia strain d4-2]